MIKDPKHEKDNRGHATADEFALHQHEKTPSGPAVCSVCRLVYHKILLFNICSQIEGEL